MEPGEGRERALDASRSNADAMLSRRVGDAVDGVAEGEQHHGLAVDADEVEAGALVQTEHDAAPPPDAGDDEEEFDLDADDAPMRTDNAQEPAHDSEAPSGDHIAALGDAMLRGMREAAAAEHAMDAALEAAGTVATGSDLGLGRLTLHSPTRTAQSPPPRATYTRIARGYPATTTTTTTTTTTNASRSPAAPDALYPTEPTLRRAAPSWGALARRRGSNGPGAATNAGGGSGGNGTTSNHHCHLHRSRNAQPHTSSISNLSGRRALPSHGNAATAGARLAQRSRRLRTTPPSSPQSTGVPAATTAQPATASTTAAQLHLSHSSRSLGGGGGANTTRSHSPAPATSSSGNTPNNQADEESRALEDDEEPICGWDQELFVEAPDELLRCPVCGLVMRDAVQCVQQHCFCKPCLTTALAHKSSCPVCRTLMTWEDAQPNRMVRAMVDRLVIRCRNHVHGCRAERPVGEIETHHKACDFAIVTCLNEECQHRLPRNEMAGHLKTCQYSRITCDDCGERFLVSQRSRHSCLRFVLGELRHLANALRERDATIEALQQKNSDLEARVLMLEEHSYRIQEPSRDASPTSSVSARSHRPVPGDIVVLSHDYELYADAADGPLDIGWAGWVLADDLTDDLPIRVHVHTRGEWWYAAGALRVIAKPNDVVSRQIAIKGLPVVRGPSWKWGNQDGGPGKVGFITRCKGDWCECTWPHGELENAYRIGPHKFDLTVANMVAIPPSAY